MAASTHETVAINHLVSKPVNPPCAIVIFGGAGALSHRKLLPALYNLSLDGVAGAFPIVAFSMEDLDDESYRQLARDAIEKFSRRPLEAAAWGKFAPRVHYVRGRFTERGDYDEVAPAARGDRSTPTRPRAITSIISRFRRRLSKPAPRCCTRPG